MLAQLLHIVRGRVHSAVNYTSHSSCIQIDKTELICSWLRIDYSDSHQHINGSGSRQRSDQSSSTPAPATQQLVLTAARHNSSSLSLQLAFSSQQQSAPAALYIDVQLCTSTSKQFQPTEMRPVWGVQINNHKQRTTTAVQLIEWQHHISYACQCVNTYTPTANIRILLLSEWLKHLYSKCIV